MKRRGPHLLSPAVIPTDQRGFGVAAFGRGKCVRISCGPRSKIEDIDETGRVGLTRQLVLSRPATGRRIQNRTAVALLHPAVCRPGRAPRGELCATDVARRTGDGLGAHDASGQSRADRVSHGCAAPAGVTGYARPEPSTLSGNGSGQIPRLGTAPCRRLAHSPHPRLPNRGGRATGISRPGTGRCLVKPLFGSEIRGITRITDEAVAWRVFKSLVQLELVIYLQQFISHHGWNCAPAAGREPNPHHAPPESARLCA